jgi:hypothetical protein
MGLVDLVVNLLIVANILMLISNIPSFRTLLKERNIITGYSIIGCGLTLIGCIIFDICYLLFGFYSVFFISLPTDIFWVLAFIFSLKKWLKR